LDISTINLRLANHQKYCIDISPDCQIRAISEENKKIVLLKVGITRGFNKEKYFSRRMTLYLPVLRQLIQVSQARMVAERPGSFCGSLWKSFDPLLRKSEPADIEGFLIIIKSDICLHSESKVQVANDYLYRKRELGIF
jgi:hypothetical protein